MTRDTIYGPVTIRPYDGQALNPYFWATRSSSRVPFAILSDLKSFPVEQTYSTVEEVKAAREKK